MASRNDVEAFLKELHTKMRVYPIAYRPRDKNKKCLEELEIIPSRRDEVIRALGVNNYVSGPNKDTYDPGKADYYEFGYKIKNVEIYIKISIGNFGKLIDCMSFHEAERELKFPLRI